MGGTLNWQNHILNACLLAVRCAVTHIGDKLGSDFITDTPANKLVTLTFSASESLRAPKEKWVRNERKETLSIRDNFQLEIYDKNTDIL